MLEQLHELRTRYLKTREKILETEGLDPKWVDKTHCLNNFDELIDSLIQIEKETQFKSFPVIVKEATRRLVGELSPLLQNVESEMHPNHINPLLEKMDSVYEYCLKYGIVTNGRDVKKIQQLYSYMMAHKNSVYEELRNVVKHARRKRHEIDTEVKKSVEEIIETKNQKKQEVIDKGQELLTGLDPVNTQVTQDLQNLITEANQKVQGIEAKESEAASSLNSMTQIAANIGKKKERSDEHLNHISSVRNEIDEHLGQATNVIGEIQNRAKQIDETRAEINSKLESANNSSARIQEIEGSANVFYEKVEEYKESMREIKNTTDASWSELKEATETEIKEFQEKTDNIIIRNEELQSQVDSILAGATDAGLFHEFESRSKSLAGNTSRWMKWFIASIIFGVFVVAFIAFYIKGTVNAGFIIRLFLSVPAAYFIYFSAAQYSRERRLQEEYAFKSVISLSLDQYRKLLIRMRKEDDLESDFVKKLMLEAFDNPSKRAFKSYQESETEDLKGQIEGLIDSVKERKDEQLTQKGMVGLIKNALGKYFM